MVPAQKPAHARILLKPDGATGGPAWTDDRIAEAVEVSTDLVGQVRQRFVEDSLDAALSRRRPDKPSRERTPGRRAEARLIALAYSPPPDGRKRRTMQLLADVLIGLEVVDAVSDETVRRAPKTRPGRSCPRCPHR